MSITSADGWFAAARQNIRIAKNATVTTVAAQTFSLWAVAGNPGAATLAVGNTTTGVKFDYLSAGCPIITAYGNAGANTGYLARARFKNSVAGGAQLYDRIWGAGAISMTSLGTTSFSGQPSITERIMDFDDLVLLIEITTTVSATATTIAVGYTNQSGTTGRTTGATASLSGYTTPRVIEMPLQAGDSGVQKINSVTVGGTVASAGAFNVILARKLASFDIRIANSDDAQAWDLTGATIIPATACLWLVAQPDSTSSGVPAVDLTIING